MIKSFVLFPFLALMLVTTACNSQSSQTSEGKPGVTSLDTNSDSFYKNVDAKFFKSLLGKEGTELLDVRTPGEFASGHIAGADNLNVFDGSFNSKIQKMDKSKTYLVYCQSGMRSGKAMRKMRAMGFSKIYNLSGGVRAWNYAGFNLQ